MNKIVQNMAAGGGTGVLFLLQIIVASGTMNFLFFPAISLYLATYMTASFAFIIGILAGSIWDSMSLAPFGVHALLLGGCMGSASFSMRFMDERNIAAHGFAAFFFWGIYSIILGAVYFLLEKESHVIVLQGHDALAGFSVLIAASAGHLILRKLNLSRNKF